MYIWLPVGCCESGIPVLSHMFTLGEEDHMFFKYNEMLFRMAYKSETSLIFRKSIFEIISPRRELNFPIPRSPFLVDIPHI